MPTPKSGYRTKSGEKVPGTTTIIGRFKESGALIRWAYNRGKDGLELYDSRDKAAEIGTIAHSMVETFINGEDPLVLLDGLTPEDARQAESSFESFREWYDPNAFNVVAQEVGMVSEIHKFGGTPDAVAVDSKGRLVLLDWKTSNGVYTDYLIQLAAYRILWNENNPGNPLTGGSHLCRFAKSNGDFAHHYYPNLDDAEKAFLLMRELYGLDSNLKKRA